MAQAFDAARMAESFRYSILPTARVMARWISSTTACAAFWNFSRPMWQ